MLAVVRPEEMSQARTSGHYEADELQGPWNSSDRSRLSHQLDVVSEQKAGFARKGERWSGRG